MILPSFALLLLIGSQTAAERSSEAAQTAENSTRGGQKVPAAVGWAIPANLTILQRNCSGSLELSGLSQSGTSISSGFAMGTCSAGGEPLRGRVTGSFDGSNLRLTVDWGCVKRPWPLPCVSSIGIYEGVVADGGFIQGVTFDRTVPNGARVTWRSAQPLNRAQ